MSKPRVVIRYYTTRFHAKLFVFDEAAMVGSANMTQGGFQGNREVVACLTEEEDGEAVAEARAVFHLLWGEARALSQGTLREFARV